MRTPAALLWLLFVGAGDGVVLAPSVPFQHSRIALDEKPTRVVVGQLDADTVPDIALVTLSQGLQYQRELQVRLGDGSGRFGPGYLDVLSLGEGGNGAPLHVVDVNHDGLDDLAQANTPSCQISIRLGDGSGSFPLFFAAGTFGGYMEDVQFSDVDDDAFEDAVILNNDLGYYFDILHNDGDGSFSTPGFDTAPFFPADSQLLLADLDGADPPGSSPDEALIASSAGLDLAWSEDDRELLPQGVGDVICADVDADGDLDVLATLPLHDLAVLLRNDGTGHFPSRLLMHTGNQPEALVAFDADGDGDLDLAVANAGGRSLSLFQGNGAGGFAPDGKLAVGRNPIDVAAADFDLDGDLDLIAACHGDATLSVLLNGSVP